MPGCSTARHPTGVTITFDEDSHTYTSVIGGDTITYTSGTQFIGQFFKPFDTDAIAPRTARKLGKTVDEVKEMWKKKGEDACKFGTAIHETIEDVLYGRELRQHDFRDLPTWEKTFSYAKAIGQTIKNRLNIVGIEKIVFDPAIKIAGTIDFLGQSKSDPLHYYIIDHKTNSHPIDEDNPWHKFALDPITDIPDTSFGHYSLQLSLYKHILITNGYVPAEATFDMFLNHVTYSGVKFIKVPDHTDAIVKMIRCKTT